MVERNAEVAPDERVQFRVGIHLGDVVEESDGDLMGGGVNVAARLEGVAKPSAICLSEDAYRQVKQRLDLKVTDFGATQLKNIAASTKVSTRSRYLRDSTERPSTLRVHVSAEEPDAKVVRKILTTRPSRGSRITDGSIRLSARSPSRAGT
jgi:hypothetical protein